MRGGTGDDMDYYQLYGGKNTIIDTDDSLDIDTVYINIDGFYENSERVGVDLHIKNPADATHLTIIKDYFNHTNSAYRKHFITKNNYYLLSSLQATNNAWALAGSTLGETLHGSHVSDSINGLGGNDVLYGHLGNDRIYGGSGNDILYGGGGDDSLYGGNGNDTLVGNDGDDNLEGGNGSDTYVFAAGSGSDTIYDSEDPNAIDTLRFSNIASTQVSFSRVGSDLGIVGFGGGADGVLVQYYFHNQSTYNKKFVFNDKTLTLADMQSGVRRFTLNGTAAADTLYGSKVADAIYGLNGNDILYGYDGNDVLQGGLGNDTVFGHVGNDGLNGNEGNDVLNGGKGSDILYGGISNDTDQYIFYQGDGKDMVIDTDDTTATDTLRFTNINSATATFSKSGNDLIVKYGTGSDQVAVKQFYDASVKAGRKQFQFADKTITAAQLPALLQQAQALKTAVAGLSSKESAIAVPANTASNTVNLTAAV